MREFCKFLVYFLTITNTYLFWNKPTDLEKDCSLECMNGFCENDANGDSTCICHEGYFGKYCEQSS